MPFTTPSEYTGIYKIATDQFSEAILTDFITQNETEILLELFGVDLYNLFIDDLNPSNVPQTARFLSVYNAFAVQDVNNGFVFYAGSPFDPYVLPSVTGGCVPKSGKNENKIYQSYGIKDMLRGFVYYQYNTKSDMQATPVGMRTSDAMAATMGSNPLRNNRLTDAYNRAVKSYQSIQYYMSKSEFKDNYPEYNGIEKQPIVFGGFL